MSLGGALLLIAVGAILKWAVTAHVSWIDLHTVGTILFVVGLVGLALAVLWTFWWSQRDPDPDKTRVLRPPPSPR